MSHFTKIKTRLVKKDFVVKALTDLGFQAQEGQVKIRGWNGQQTPVDIMAPTKNPGYDIGFQKAEGTYDLVADWYGIHDIQPESLLKQIQQRYAYHAVMDNMRDKGFEVVEEENEEDNTIHLTVRRAVF